MTTSDSLPEAVAALHTFAQALAAHPDIAVRAYTIGPPAAPELLDQLRGRVPDEWLDLAAIANGISLAWQSIKHEKDRGALQVPALTADTNFLLSPVYGSRLGPDGWGLLFDSPSYHGGTWLVADGEADRSTARLVFVRYYQDEPLHPMGSSLAHYLHQAVAAGLAHDWPLAASHPEVQARIKRICKSPTNKLQVGMRVDSGVFNGLCRGEVLRVHLVDLQGELAKRTFAPRNGIYALIRYDLGYTFWQSSAGLKPLPQKPDLHEALRLDPWLLVRWGETEGWPIALTRMALLWGPITGNFSGYADSSWLVAALLRSLSLNEGAELLRRVAAGVQASGLDVEAPLPLPEAMRALAGHRAAHWRRRNWEQPAYQPLQILVNGYCARVLVEPEAGREELSLETLDELEAFPVWGLQRPFHHTRRLLVLNNDEHKMYLDEPSAELPADYPIITHSAY